MSATVTRLPVKPRPRLADHVETMKAVGAAMTKLDELGAPRRKAIMMLLDRIEKREKCNG
jgi:hypothetical protein